MNAPHPPSAPSPQGGEGISFLLLSGFSFRASIFSNFMQHFEKSDLPPKAILAWSFGGLSAIEFCKTFPEHVSHLILIGTSPCFLSTSDWQGVAPLDFESFEKKLQNDRPAALKIFRQWVQYPRADRAVQALLAEHQRDDEDLVAELNFFAHRDLRDAYRKLTVPTLHLVGEQDPLVKLESLKRLAPLNSSIHLEAVGGAGHAPFLTHPVEIKKHISAFLS